MTALKIVQTGQADFEAQWRQLRQKLTLEAALLDDTQRLEQVRKIVGAVRTDGDKAVAELTAKFDRVELSPAEFRIPEQELKQAHERMNAKLLEALRLSIANVRDYQEAIKVQQIANPPGSKMSADPPGGGMRTWGVGAAGFDGDYDGGAGPGGGSEGNCSNQRCETGA